MELVTTPSTRFLFFLLLLLPLNQALTFETKSINGSLWYAANNNGTISSYVWLNASSGNAQMATTQTNSSRELIAHSNWTTFHYGFARWNGALGRFVGQGSDDLSEFTTYGFTDNATYWRTEANGTRNVGGRSLTSSLKHYQGNYDDFVNETWELSYSTNLTLGFDLWYFQAMKNISFLDTASYGNETYFTGHPLNETQYFDNFTYLTVINFTTAEGWQYSMPVTDYGNKLAIYNGSVYIGINVGRKVGALRTWSLQKIDATPCSSTCGFGDSVNVDINQTDSNSCGQVGYQLCNNSFEASWQDYASSCTLKGQCKLRLLRNIPSAIGSTFVTINGTRGTPPGSAWATCNVESQDIPSSRGGCTLSSATPALAEVPDSTNVNARPLKGLSYPFNITQVGIYNILGFNALVKACLQTWGGGTYNVCSVAVDPAGTDTVIPNVTLPGIINNSMNTFYSTNGSLDWVNVTLNWGCYDDGLCNNSVLYTNTSGALTKVAQPDLIDFWNATTAYTFNYSKNKMYRVCAIMNDTNKNSNSTSGNPKVCYQFAVNIIPVPKPTANNPFSFIIIQNEEDENKPKLLYYAALVAIAIAGYVAVKRYV